MSTAIMVSSVINFFSSSVCLQSLILLKSCHQSVIKKFINAMEEVDMNLMTNLLNYITNYVCSFLQLMLSFYIFFVLFLLLCCLICHRHRCHCSLSFPG